MSAPNVGQFVDLLVSIPAEGHGNSFACVMSEWTKQQGKQPSSAVCCSSILNQKEQGETKMRD